MTKKLPSPTDYPHTSQAMPRQQLLGSMNLDTREWSDGVLTAAARKVWTLNRSVDSG